MANVLFTSHSFQKQQQQQQQKTFLSLGRFHPPEFFGIFAFIAVRDNFPKRPDVRLGEEKKTKV